MRNAIEKNPNMSEADALALLDRCLKVLYYRDARSLNKVITHSIFLPLKSAE